MVRFWLVAGSLLAGLAVAAGAFGAHGLKTRCRPTCCWCLRPQCVIKCIMLWVCWQWPLPRIAGRMATSR